MIHNGEYDTTIQELQCQHHGELVIHNEHISKAESFVLRLKFFSNR